MKGRRSKSAAEKALAGNPGKRPIPGEKQAESGEVFFSEPPSVLSSAAKAIWHSELPTILERVILLPQGMRIFTMYCSIAARWEQLEADLNKEGTTYTTGTGYIRERPEVRQRDRAFADMMKLAEQLNLSPKSWINSMSQFQARQLDLFAKKSPANQTQGAAPSSQPDELDDFVSNRPPVH